MSLQQELDYFIENQEELVKQHGGKTLVIKDRKIVGVHDSMLDAYLEAKKKYEPGTFAIQPCIPGPEAYTVTLSTPAMV